VGLSVENLEVELGEKRILKDVSLTVRPGELFSLLGPSGCGKSTLLKTIAGLIRQREGTIRVQGQIMDELAPHRRHAVIVFQDLRVFPHLSALQNVAFPLKMQGVDKAERRREALRMLEAVQLEELADRRASELSGGQQQRVVLARAIMARPKLLLLDEPFSSLDENLRNDMRDLLRRLHETFELTTILVTHDQKEALKLSDRIALMREGRIIQCDTPRRIYEDPTSWDVARYFVEGNSFEGTVRAGRFTAPGLELDAPVADGAYRLVIRPEAVRVAGADAGVVEKAGGAAPEGAAPGEAGGAGGAGAGGAGGAGAGGAGAGGAGAEGAAPGEAGGAGAEGRAQTFCLRQLDFLGDRKELTVAVADALLRFTLPADQTLLEQEEIRLTFEQNHLLFFDQDGQRVPLKKGN
jgi:ABC-type Fe3+/spermidine/putrescine transport system ATPase subunit